MPKIWLLLCALWVGQALAAQPANTLTDPVLRINAGMHLGKIHRLALDKSGRFLVTASEDKTARVWDLASGRLLQTLRPPLGSDKEGELYASAMSPDGNLVALGGFTQNGETGLSVYVLNRASGQMHARLTNLPHIVRDIAWSADGRYLAIALNAGGIRLYRTDTWAHIGSDADYSRACSRVEFGARNTLVTSALDGYVRVYTLSGDALQLVKKGNAPGGNQPLGVRFSPDASQIVVGFQDSAQVNVLDTKTLRFQYAPDTQGVANGNFGSVDWSADGKFLYAAGLYQISKRTVIRRWMAKKNGSFTDSAAASNAILDLRATPSGDIVFAAADPAWGIVSSQGLLLRQHNGPTADFRDNFQNLALSDDGTVVSFGYALNGRFPARFDADKGLIPGDDPALPLYPALTETTGFEITGWRNTSQPKLNGSALHIGEHNKSRSVAIAPDGSAVALGTNDSLLLFDPQGKRLWEIPTSGIAWAINISGDGRHVVAAFDDGTIRWFDKQDGRERLSFFPHADRKRWVAWTPAGEYNASAGGEDLIGWHINQGRDQSADFFGASRFRTPFYQPDIALRVLTRPDSTSAQNPVLRESALKISSQQVKVNTILPPVLLVSSPTEASGVSSNQVEVTYSVRTPHDAPLTRLRVRVNGQAVDLPGAPNLSPATNGNHVVIVPIPERDSEIQLFAENKNGVSPPGTVRVLWRGSTNQNDAKNAPKAKLYMVAVGVSKYDKADYQLDFAAKDATDFARSMKQQKNTMYRDVEVKLLTDKDATRDQVLSGLQWLQSRVTASDVGMLFLAGHGINDAEQNFYFLPVNADVKELKKTGVVFTEIRNTMARMQGKSLFFVDACHSGNVLGGRRLALADMNLVVNDMTSEENGVVVFSSSTRKQLSQESSDWNNGAFTKALVEGISGKADLQKNGSVTYKELDVYVGARVSELTNGEQTPVTQAPGGIPDFTIATLPP